MSTRTDAADGLLERDHERHAIASARAAVAAGGSATVLITGPAGIGRSALLESVLTVSGFTTVATRGIELERGFAFGAVLRLLGSRIDLGSDRPLPAGAGPAIRGLLQHGRAPGEPQVDAVIRGLVQLLANRAQRGPLLVAVDDLATCDEPSIRTLVELAEARARGLLLVITAQHGDVTEHPAVEQLRGAPGAQTLPLRALSREALVSIVGERADAWHRHTGGNPLFVREMLRDGVEPDDPASPSLVRLISRRVGRLSSPGQATAAAVAVLNGPADPTLLAPTSALDAASLRTALAELERAGVVDRPAAVIRHPVVREAVLAALPLRERLALHVRAARALADAGQPRAAAAHLHQARESEQALSPWAADVLLRAADEAGGGSVERQRCLRHALRCRIDRPQEQRARLALGSLLVQHHDRAGLEQLERAQRLTAGGPPAAEVAVQRAAALFHLARMPESAAICRDALGQLDPADPASRDLRLRLEASALAAEAANGSLSPPVVPAELTAGEVRSTGERAILSRLAWTLATMGTVPADRVRTLAHRAIGGSALVREAGASSPAFVYAASALVIAGDPGSVVTLTGDAARRARDADEPIAVTYALALRGQARFALGHMLEAASDAQTALDGLDATDLPAQAVAMAWRLETAVAAGDLRRADADLERAGMAGELPDLGPVHLLLLARAGLRVAQGQLPRALADLEQLRERVGPRYANPSSLIWKPRLATVLAATGDREAALATIEPAVERAAFFGVARAHGQCLHARGVIRGGRAGEQDLRHAVERLASTDAPLDLARALIDLGAHPACGDREARALLRRALDTAHGIGATALVDGALRRLRAAGARPRRPRVAGTHVLRPQRRLVVELAAEGHDDREIGDRLFLREQTVAEHVRGGLDALGIASRADLSARVVGRHDRPAPPADETPAVG